MFPKLSRADETLPEDVAEFIADSLAETEELPRSQIAKVTKVLGREETLALLREVERIEAAGGLLVPDGSRRRTPGGVFFHLARQKLPRPVRFRIFAPPQPPPEVDPATSAPIIPVQKPLKPPPPPPRGGRPRTVEVEYVRRAPRPPTPAPASPVAETAPTDGAAPESVAGAGAATTSGPAADSSAASSKESTATGAPDARPVRRRTVVASRLRAEATGAQNGSPAGQPPAQEPTPSAAPQAPSQQSAAQQSAAQQSAAQPAPTSITSTTSSAEVPATPKRRRGATTTASPTDAKTASSTMTRATKTTNAKKTSKTTTTAKASAKVKAQETSTRAPRSRPAAKAKAAPKRAAATSAVSPARKRRASVDPLGDAIQKTVEQELSKLSPEERRLLAERLLGGSRTRRR